MSICKVAPPHFLSVQKFHEQRVCGTKDKTKKKMAQQHGLLLPLIYFLYIFISGDIWSLLFMIQKSVTFKTCNNEYRMDLRWFVWHLEFCGESGNHCSEARRPVRKLKVDTWSTLIIRNSQLGNHASEGQSSYSNTFPTLNKHEPSINSRPVKHATHWRLWYVPPTLPYLHRFTVLLFYCLIQTRNHGRSILYPCAFPQRKTHNCIRKKEGYIISSKARCQVGFRIWLATCFEYDSLIKMEKLESVQPATDTVIT